MLSEDGLNRTGGAYLSVEAGHLARNSVAALAVFVATAAVAGWVRHLARTSIGMTVLLSAFAFVFAFVGMRIARIHIRRFVRRQGWLYIPPMLGGMLVISSPTPLLFAVLFGLHALSCLFLRVLKNRVRLGIELIMLITVLGSFVYGPKIGALMGAGAMFMDYALSARFSYFVPLTTSAYVLVGLAAGSFAYLGITAVGIAATIIYNLVTSFIIVAFMGGHIDKCLRFGLSNLVLNMALFTSAAPLLLSIMS